MNAFEGSGYVEWLNVLFHQLTPGVLGALSHQLGVSSKKCFGKMSIKGKTALDKWPSLLKEDGGSAGKASSAPRLVQFLMPGLAAVEFGKADARSFRTPCRRKAPDLLRDFEHFCELL